MVLDLTVLGGTTLAQTAGVDTLAVLTGLLGRTLTAAAASNSCKYKGSVSLTRNIALF